MAPRAISWLARLAHALVRLLPEDFRSEFGDSIKADLAQRHAKGDRAGLIRRELPSLVGALAREHASALRQDVTYSLRLMRRTPGFTCLAVLMFGLGTGVNAAVGSVVDAVLLRSPFPRPGQLVQVLDTPPGKEPAYVLSQPRYLELAASPGPFSAVAAFGGGSHVTTATGVPTRLDAECMSASMFDVLGTPPVIGRTYAAFDDQPGAPATLVLAYAYWQRLGGSPSILGSTIVVNQTPVTVVGVMPRGFLGPLLRDAEAWVPLNRPYSGGGATGCRPSTSPNVFARVRDGLSVEDARARLTGLGVVSHIQSRLDDSRKQLGMVVGACAFILLIACFNVGGLQMERTLARRREFAIRASLGASTSRLVRATVTDNLILALAGTAAGIAGAAASLRGLITLLPTSTPHLDVIEINVRVLAATVVAGSLAGIVAGLLPFGVTSRVSTASDLSSSLRSTRRHHNIGRRLLVTTQIALSVVVLICAGLILRTFITLRPAQPGFDPARKLSLSLTLQGETGASRSRLVSDLFQRLRGVDGIRRMSVSTYLPLRGNSREQPVTFAGTTARINTGYISAGFLEMMGIPLKSGRTFTEQDTAASMPVAVVDELFAKRIRADGNVLGERVAVRLSMTGPLVERQIVGVIGSTRYGGWDTSRRPIAYIPYAQDPIDFFLVVAETDGRPTAAVEAPLKAAVHALRPELALGDVDPLPAMLTRSVSLHRANTWLMGAFAVLAVGLSSIGLLTTMGWWVRQRTRELGVRAALGATRTGIAALVVRQGLALSAGGILAGLGLASRVTKYLESSLYGVTPLDPSTFVVCAIGMLLISLAAIGLPVRRATGVDPVVALSAE